MGNNSNSKLIAGSIAGSLTVGGLAYYLLSSNMGEKKPRNSAEGIKIGEVHVSPVISPITHKIREFDPKQLSIIAKMEKHFKNQNNKIGRHLEVQFFEDIQDILFLRTSEKVQKVKDEVIQTASENFKNYKITEYEKSIQTAAKKISEIIEQEEDRIADVFSEPVFVQASKIYLIRYNCDALMKTLVIGSPLKHWCDLKTVNPFGFSKVVKYIKSKIESRLEQGFDDVHKDYFPVEFRLQLESEVLAKFGVSLDGIWSYGMLHDIGSDRLLWDGMISEYCRMMKSYYHSMTVYSPGIKLE